MKWNAAETPPRRQASFAAFYLKEPRLPRRARDNRHGGLIAAGPAVFIKPSCFQGRMGFAAMAHSLPPAPSQRNVRMANPTPRQHTYRQFDQELAGIRSDALRLGGLAEEQIALAMAALAGNDVALAEHVIAGDRTLNELEMSVNQQCLQILARRQPAAIDLRLVVAVIKAANDLERIGDDAKRIARITLSLADSPPPKPQFAALLAFAEGVGKLLHDTLDAFARVDAGAAMEAKRRDQFLDRQYGEIMSGQIAAMSADPRAIPAALSLMWVARALERVGDRSCNLCEYTVYYALGKDIRHLSPEQAAIDLMGRCQ
jgi:phosphate transport system protein